MSAMPPIAPEFVRCNETRLIDCVMPWESLMTTYVAFDGDKDIWAYRYMRGWSANQRIDFELSTPTTWTT
jgi:hypothetical protein